VEKQQDQLTMTVSSKSVCQTHPSLFEVSCLQYFVIVTEN
jgi:hypothetical protein